MTQVVWSIKELVEAINSRIKNEFDCNILVTGTTGLGKSSLINKILLRFYTFDQWKHQVYSRKDTISLLKDQKLSYCWNDELISSAFKRTHYDVEQIDLIETLTKYRCNYNVFMGALPVLFTLDKELLKLFALNLDVIGRGVAVIHRRIEGRRYNDDPWDTKINAKLEERWSRQRQRNPNFKIPYHKYTTFVGYLYWEDLTPNQKTLYQEIRDTKKREMEESKENINESGTFYEKLLNMIVNKEIDENGLTNMCILSNKELMSVKNRLYGLLKEKGINDTLKTLLKKPDKKEEKSKVNESILKELSLS